MLNNHVSIFTLLSTSTLLTAHRIPHTASPQTAKPPHPPAFEYRSDHPVQTQPPPREDVCEGPGANTSTEERKRRKEKEERKRRKERKKESRERKKGLHREHLYYMSSDDDRRSFHYYSIQAQTHTHTHTRDHVPCIHSFIHLLLFFSRTCRSARTPRT